MSISSQKERAFNIIKGHLKEFAPELGQRKEENPIFNIKTELYRLPNFLIGAVADYFGIKSLNTWAKLKELGEQKILSNEARDNLKKMFTDVMDLRVKCHLFYGRECDDAYHPSMEFKVSSEERLKRVFILTDLDMEKIVHIYQVLLPLFHAFEQAYKDKDFSILSEKSFFDSSLLAQAEAYGKMHSYQTAIDCYKKALALDPNNAETAFMLAKMLWTSAQYVEAEKYATKAILLANDQKDQEIVSWSLNLQGLIAKDLAQWDQAIQNFTGSLQVAKQRKDEEMIAALLSNLGQVWNAVGQHRKAIEFTESAVTCIMQIRGNDALDLVEAYCNLGASWFFLENYKKAIEFYEMSLAVSKQNQIQEEFGIIGTLFNNLMEAIQAYDEELSHEETRDKLTFSQASDREKVELRSFPSQGERALLIQNNEEGCYPCVIT